MLATPVTPAALLGHTDASPRSVPLADCGWPPSHVWRAIKTILGQLLPSSPDYERLGQRWQWELAASVNWPYGLTGTYGLPGQAEKVAAAIHAAPEYPQLREVSRDLEGKIAALLQQSGVTVSLSAYNADEDCLTVYVHGRPLCWL